jgi:hypothetical protein
MLCLYPPSFRRQFADEMTDDFQQATEEAWASGFVGVLVLWTRVARDFFGSLAYQWLRSGLAGGALIPAAFSLLVTVLLHTAPRPTLAPRPRNYDPQMNEMVLVMAVVVLIVAATVVITGRFWLSVFRRSRVSR